MTRRKGAIFKTLFVMGILTVLPVIFILTNPSAGKQDIRSKAAPGTLTPAQIIFIPFTFTKDKNDDTLLEFDSKPQIRNGFVPPIQSQGSGQYFTAALLDGSGHIIYSQKFSLPENIAIDSYDAGNGRAKAELKKVSASNQGVALPYRLDAKFAQITYPGGEIQNISLEMASSANNIININEIHGDNISGAGKLLNFFPAAIQKVFAGNGTFNIAIIGDNYNGDNLHFQGDVNDIVSGLISVEPFKSYQSNITFYPQLSPVQICTYTASLSCNDTLALQQASTVPYDKVYVLYNGPYAGYAYVNGTLSYGSSASDKTAAVKKGLFIHEMAGHTLGGLMDEYSYGTTGTSYAPNCSSSSSCPAWSAIQGLGCFATCGYTNLYRPTDNSSVMNTAILNGFLPFDQFSTQIVQGKLLSFLGGSPPTPTLPPVQPTATATPVPTATATPTATPIVTPTPTLPALGSIPRLPDLSITPAVTVTPSPTASPSPSPTPTTAPIPPCSFPNFCTVAKLCGGGNILPNSCGVETRICCRVIQANSGTINPLSANVTPTIVQKLDALPTVAVTTPLNSPTPTPPPVSVPTVIINNTPAAPPAAIPNAGQTNPVTATTQPPAPTTTNVPAGPKSMPSSTPMPTNTPEVNFVYSSPTPYQVENIVFERTTPTPTPRVKFIDILQAPTLFVNSLLTGFFSIFGGK